MTEKSIVIYNIWTKDITYLLQNFILEFSKHWNKNTCGLSMPYYSENVTKLDPSVTSHQIRTKTLGSKAFIDLFLKLWSHVISPGEFGERKEVKCSMFWASCWQELRERHLERLLSELWLVSSSICPHAFCYGTVYPLSQKLIYEVWHSTL